MTDKLTIFDFIKALTEKKINLTLHDRFNSDYSPYMVSRFLSMHPSTIYFAHFANNLEDKKMHYMFLLNALPHEKIYLKYIKKDKLEDTKIIQKCYDISEERAMGYVDILSKKDLKEIKKKYGGK